MKEYDVYLPMSYNDGSPVEPDKVKAFRRALIDQFGGLTHFPQENEGVWKMGNTTFRDKIVILRVLAEDGPAARHFLQCFRLRLQQELRQESILIVEREVKLLQ